MNCRTFDTCCAPLCPLDPSSLENSVWFPEEPVCTRQGIGFAKKQRKLMRKGIKRDTCFTFAMLERLWSISVGTSGINPEYEKVEVELTWMKNHPQKPKVSNEITELRRQTMANLLLSKKKAGIIEATAPTTPSDVLSVPGRVGGA